MANEWTPARAGLAELAQQLGSSPTGLPGGPQAPLGGNQLCRWLVAHSVLSCSSWPDPEAARFGHEARSLYVERFWLPIIGPTALLAFRALQFGEVEIPIPLSALGAALGVGSTVGTNSTVVRSLARLVEFRLARIDREAYRVRSHVMPLSARLRQRLPQHLQALHARMPQGGER